MLAEKLLKSDENYLDNVIAIYSGLIATDHLLDDKELEETIEYYRVYRSR